MHGCTGGRDRPAATPTARRPSLRPVPGQPQVVLRGGHRGPVPASGQARLCYRRTAEVSISPPRRLAHAGACAAVELDGPHGWTLHQLRNSMLADDVAGLGVDVSIRLLPGWADSLAGAA